MLVSRELQEYYENQLDMMSSVGWKDLCEDLNRILVGLSDITTTTPDTLLNRQGRVAEINCILNRKETLHTAFNELSK